MDDTLSLSETECGLAASILAEELQTSAEPGLQVLEMEILEKIERGENHFRPVELETLARILGKHYSMNLGRSSGDLEPWAALYDRMNRHLLLWQEEQLRRTMDTEAAQRRRLRQIDSLLEE